MNTQGMYAAPWLKAEDLKGNSHELAIANVELKEFTDSITKEKENKLVVGFKLPDGRLTEKRLILNATHYKVIVKVTGSTETDDWIGKKVILSPGVTSGGKDTINVAGGMAQVAAGAPTF